MKRNFQESRPVTDYKRSRSESLTQQTFQPRNNYQNDQKYQNSQNYQQTYQYRTQHTRGRGNYRGRGASSARGTDRHASLYRDPPQNVQYYGAVPGHTPPQNAGIPPYFYFTRKQVFQY